MEIGNQSIVSARVNISSHLSMKTERNESDHHQLRHNRRHGSEDHGMQKTRHEHSHARKSGMGSNHVDEGSKMHRSHKDHGMQRGHRTHQHRDHGYQQRSDLGMSAFKQEIQRTTSSSSTENSSSSLSQYKSVTQYSQGGDSPKDIVKETLMTAKRIMTSDPESGSKSLITFRQKIETAAIVAKESASSETEVKEIDETLGMMNEGLDELDNEAGNMVSSSASVLALEHHERQGASIKIRTQEGDIVQLRLMQSSHMSLGDVSVENETGSASLTSLAVSNHSGLRISIEGDLNEDELEAIKNVFAKAEEIANEFFEGDLAEAFNLASEFEFNSDQLARVKLGFRSEQRTTVAYAETSTTTPVISNDGMVSSSETEDGNIIGSEDSSAVTNASEAEVVNAEDAVNEGSDDADVIENAVVENTNGGDTSQQNEAESAPATVNTSALNGFFDLISSFRRSTSEGFESESSDSKSTLKYHYTESFKLDILKSVINETAPEELAEAANVANLVIDSAVSESGTEESNTEESEVTETI